VSAAQLVSSAFQLCAGNMKVGGQGWQAACLLSPMYDKESKAGEEEKAFDNMHIVCSNKECNNEQNYQRPAAQQVGQRLCYQALRGSVITHAMQLPHAPCPRFDPMYNSQGQFVGSPLIFCSSTMIIRSPGMSMAWKRMGIAAEAATASGKGPLSMRRCWPFTVDTTPTASAQGCGRPAVVQLGRMIGRMTMHPSFVYLYRENLLPGCSAERSTDNQAISAPYVGLQNVTS